MKPGYFTVLAQSENNQTAFYIYTGIGRHTLVFKQTQMMISAPKIEVFDQLPFQNKLSEAKEYMLNKDAETILRQIDEDSAKEHQELTQQLEKNIQDAFNEIDGASYAISDNETGVQSIAYGANRLKHEPKKHSKKVADLEEPTTSQQLLGEKYSKHLKTAAKDQAIYHPKQSDKPKEPK